MRFPRRRRRPRQLTGRVALVPLLLTTGLVLGAGTAVPVALADDEPTPGPPLHAVKYTVFSETPFRNAEIYYHAVDPPNFADYSHDPYAFTPNVEADLGPNQQWTMDVMLANPDDWAMVTVTSLDSPSRPNFHCVLAVDGKVVVAKQGPVGALCSIRNY
ncbi:hypothetical protein [Mycobacterium sp. AT1]|uniref:hypothetical protein n=1 Tax=Mycobacterium sp. AT1 TaxID=1961706 RepID=UPI0009D4D33B|nr:hypothetical protein [Mycobacterium sp. AT1]OPX12759.1 hypothetical protein B1790_02360 [Mycobacterium sp. AT1]